MAPDKVSRLFRTPGAPDCSGACRTEKKSAANVPQRPVFHRVPGPSSHDKAGEIVAILPHSVAFSLLILQVRQAPRSTIAEPNPIGLEALQHELMKMDDGVGNKSTIHASYCLMPNVIKFKVPKML
jgi:hypothetical protein